MGQVKLEKDSLTKPAIVSVWFPAWNFSPAEMNQCQKEAVSGCCCSFPPSFLLFSPSSCNLQFAFFYYSTNYLLRFFNVGPYLLLISGQLLEGCNRNTELESLASFASKTNEKVHMIQPSCLRRQLLFACKNYQGVFCPYSGTGMNFAEAAGSFV